MKKLIKILMFLFVLSFLSNCDDEIDVKLQYLEPFDSRDLPKEPSTLVDTITIKWIGNRKN